MTLSNAKAQFQLRASASTTASQGSGTVTLGDASIQTTSFSSADIAYGFRITAAAAGNVATLTIPSGAVAQTTGSPKVTRWGTQIADLTGEDFEGIALPTLVRLYGYTLQTPALDGTISVACSNAAFPDVVLSAQEQTVFHSFSSAASVLASLGTMEFTISNEADYIDVFIIGKTS